MKKIYQTPKLEIFKFNNQIKLLGGSDMLMRSRSLNCSGYDTDGCFEAGARDEVGATPRA